ncbi:MAG: hypothetical protein P8099_04710 [Gemmatimonadota bacterium]
MDSVDTPDLVARELARLVGLPLWAVGRAADLVWWQFGERVVAPTARDPDRIVGELALHLQCPWRFTAGTSIVAGADDLYCPADPAVPLYDFDWTASRDSVLDRILNAFSNRFGEPRVVGVEVDDFGGFALRFEHELSLAVFPDSANGRPFREMWRLFEPGRDTNHFVVGNSGLQPSDDETGGVSSV